MQRRAVVFLFLTLNICLEAHSKPSLTSNIELFAEIVNGFHSLTILAKGSIVDV